MSTTRRVSVVLAAVAAVAALTACDPNQVGTAASVEGERLSIDELQDQVMDVVESRNEAIEAHDLTLPVLDPGGDLSEMQQQVLNRWITRQLFDNIAADLQIEVSEEDIDNFLDEFSSQFPEGDMTSFLAENGYTEDTLRGEVRVALISQHMTEDAGGEAEAQEMFTEATEALNVDVNPRYGTWAEEGLTPSSGSVSVSLEDDDAAGSTDQPAGSGDGSSSGSDDDASSGSDDR